VSDRTVHSLGLQAPWRLEFFEVQDGPLVNGGFRVDAVCTGLSTGTEMSWFKGTNPFLGAYWDPRLQVFGDGEPTIGNPIRSLGYMEVGLVTESRTPAVTVGQTVAMAYGHKTGHPAAPAERFVTLPDGLDPVLGTYVAHMGPICANGLLHAAADVAGPHVRQLGTVYAAVWCWSPEAGWSACSPGCTRATMVRRR
jgi:hypothetical protein